MKTRKTELDNMQNDLVNSVKTITQVAVSRNSERAIFEGYYDATKFLCCPSCDCVSDDDHDHHHKHDRHSNENNDHGNKECNDECCPPRLKDCEEAICDICDQVKTTFCCDADNPVEPETQTQKPPSSKKA